MSTANGGISSPWPTTGSSNNTGSKNSSSKTDLANVLGKDAFLKLLITELKYQDPTNPMDNKDFISQMSTFSSLEQMQNLNTNITEMADDINGTLLPSLLLQQSSSMIGKEVNYTSTTTTDGQTSTQTLKGVIESVVMKEGALYYVIGGKEVAATTITGMSEGSLSTNDQILLEILKTLEELKSYLHPKEGGSDDQ